MDNRLTVMNQRLNFSIQHEVVEPGNSANFWKYSLSSFDSLNFDEIVLQEEQHDLPNLVVRLALWLKRIEQTLERQSGDNAQPLLSYRLLFSDTGLGRFGVEDFVKSPSQAGSDEDKQLAAASLYWAISIYLSSEDRYIHWNARRVYLFSAWQAYNLFKTVCRKGAAQQIHRYALAETYNRLSSMLEDRQFRDPVRWLASWRWADTPNIINNRQPIRDPNDQTLRKSLRRSLLLWYREDNPGNPGKIGGEEICLDKPLPAPAAFEEEPDLWRKCILHPVFHKRPVYYVPTQSFGNFDGLKVRLKRAFISQGHPAVRNLITEWLLPHYDFDSAFNLAYFMQNPSGKGLPKWLLNFFIPFGWLIVTLFVLFFNLGISYVHQNSMDNLSQSAVFFLACTQLSLIVAIVISILLIYFDHSVLLNLSLPRLLGGVAIGYSLLITEDATLEIVDAFTWPAFLDGVSSSFIGPLSFILERIGDGFLISLLWLGVFLIGFVYIYHDALPWTGNVRAAIGRALLTMGMAFSSSAFIGLLAVAISTSAYSTSDSFWVVLIGPFGWFELKQWLVFLPIALLIGLITQFLFEERTLPHSVWAQEED